MTKPNLASVGKAVSCVGLRCHILAMTMIMYRMATEYEQVVVNEVDNMAMVLKSHDRSVVRRQEQ